MKLAPRCRRGQSVVVLPRARLAKLRSNSGGETNLRSSSSSGGAILFGGSSGGATLFGGSNMVVAAAAAAKSCGGGGGGKTEPVCLGGSIEDRVAQIVL
jgi:hypothetical protein